MTKQLNAGVITLGFTLRVVALLMTWYGLP